MIGNEIKVQRLGFTLMEMLVAVTIFSLAITAAVTIFVISNQAQKRSGSLEKIDQQIKYLLEFFTNSLKESEIDYSVVNTNPYPLSPTQYFNFLSGNQEYVSWRLASASSTHVWQQCKRVDRYCLANDPESDWFDLHSRDLDLTALSIAAKPLVSPWEINPETGVYLSNEQPYFTLVLLVKKLNSQDPVTVWQTTVASRLYKR